MEQQLEDVNPLLTIDAVDDGGSATVTLRGDLDLSTSPRLMAKVTSLIERGVRDVELDLADVEFVDSSGLSAIVELSTRVQHVGGSLRTAGLSPAARRILELTGVIDHLRHHQPA